MSFLLDTDLLSAYNKRTFPKKLKDWLRVNEGDCFISVLSIAEMRHGLPGVDDPDHPIISERIAQTEILFAESLIGLDIDTLVTWKKLLASLKTINRTMTCEDSLLAATAIKNHFALATNNLRHFQPATQFGLNVVNPLD
jgi:predicted nucleic acid-binding protein